MSCSKTVRVPIGGTTRVPTRIIARAPMRVGFTREVA